MIRNTFRLGDQPDVESESCFAASHLHRLEEDCRISDLISNTVQGNNILRENRPIRSSLRQWMETEGHLRNYTERAERSRHQLMEVVTSDIFYHLATSLRD